LNHFRQLLGRYDLSALTPAVGVLPEGVPGFGYAASTDGEGHYLLYFVDERLYRLEPCPPQALSVTLNLPPGQYAAQTFDPKTGVATHLPVSHSNGTARLEIPDFSEDVVVVLDWVQICK
jgi:hypothetical protein